MNKIIIPGRAPAVHTRRHEEVTLDVELTDRFIFIVLRKANAEIKAELTVDQARKMAAALHRASLRLQDIKLRQAGDIVGGF